MFTAYYSLLGPLGQRALVGWCCDVLRAINKDRRATLITQPRARIDLNSSL